jgi:hypothetical protein
MLYSVSAVLDCMLFSVYGVLGVNSRSGHGEIERDYLTLYSCDDGKVVDKKAGDGG